MSLTEHEIATLQATFAEVEKDVDGFTGKFYGYMFETHPEVKHLFKGDMKAQGRKLAGMLKSAVQSAANLGAVVPAVEASGRRHVAYGVKKAHYDIVGSCLIHTLAVTFGDAFTPEVRELWTKVYGILASVMMSQHPE